MSQADQLKGSLERLRRDSHLRECVNELSELLSKERGLTPRQTFIDSYRNIVVRSLRRLSQEHIRQYFLASEVQLDSPALILVSYNSSVVGIGDHQRRITDWIPDKLTDSLESASLAEHIKRVLETSWLQGASRRRNVFELHLLAQKRISISGSLPLRFPIYISASSTSTLGYKSGIRIGSDFFILREVDKEEFKDGDSPVSQGIFFRLPMGELNQAEIGLALSEFISSLKALQTNTSRPYPDNNLIKEDYEAYGVYLKKLLLYRDRTNTAIPLCLCTIAISDELSNVPLGTAMVFAPYALDYDIAIGISHLCFDLFSAYYKIEQEASLLRETAFLITAWVHHEATHWSRYVGGQAENINAQIAELGDISEQVTSEGLETPGSISARLTDAKNHLSAVSEDLEAVAATATLSTELLKQLGGPSTAVIRPAEFKKNVETLLKLYPHADTYLGVQTRRQFPRALLLICCELIRNADRHFSDRGAVTGKIIIELKDESDIPTLTVKSEPHDTQDILALSALNDLGNSIHSNLDVSMQKEEQLGGILIHMLSELMGGRTQWTWEHIKSNRISVEARCKLSPTR